MCSKWVDDELGEVLKFLKAWMLCWAPWPNYFWKNWRRTTELMCCCFEKNFILAWWWQSCWFLNGLGFCIHACEDLWLLVWILCFAVSKNFVWWWLPKFCLKWEQKILFASIFLLAESLIGTGNKNKTILVAFFLAEFDVIEGCLHLGKWMILWLHWISSFLRKILFCTLCSWLPKFCF